MLQVPAVEKHWFRQPDYLGHQHRKTGKAAFICYLFRSGHSERRKQYFNIKSTLKIPLNLFDCKTNENNIPDLSRTCKR
jgi:hypothetical protein